MMRYSIEISPSIFDGTVISKGRQGQTITALRATTGDDMEPPPLIFKVSLLVALCLCGIGDVTGAES